MPTNTYDAIIVGSGISGGWAAKELCEKGLKVLLLERGRNVEHIKDYPTGNKRSLGIQTPDSPYHPEDKKKFFIQRAGIILFVKTTNILYQRWRKSGNMKQNALTG
jgi:choline dehydrogenase-like flavoprotein